MKDVKKSDSNPGPHVQRSKPTTVLQLPNRRKIFGIYTLCLLLYMWLALTLTLILEEGVNYLTLRVQFYANECNDEETLTPNPNECNSTLTSGTGEGAARTYTIYTRGESQLSNPKSTILR